MTRPSLADITQLAADRATYEERPDAEYDPDVATDLACTSAADVPALSAAIRDVLARHAREDIWNGAHLVGSYCNADGDRYPCPTVRAVTAHIDTTPQEGS